MQTTLKVLHSYAEKILTNADKHHLFARLTMRNGETDDGYEKLWLPRTSDNTLSQEARMYREKAVRLAGKDFKGISGNGVSRGGGARKSDSA